MCDVCGFVIEEHEEQYLCDGCAKVLCEGCLWGDFCAECKEV